MTSDQIQAWLAVLAVLTSAYAYSLWRNPDTKCTQCAGGRKYGWVFGNASRPCWRCGGAGRIPRLPIRIARVVKRILT